MARFAVLGATLLLTACGGEPDVALGPEGALEVDGAQLHYWTVGSGATVVLLHDGPGLGSGYLLGGLAMPGFPPEGFRWVAYDQRGSGRSTGAEDPAKLTMARFVEDLEAVRAASGQDRVALLGHGFGGLLALHYAVRHPDRVAALILLDPDPAQRGLWAAHEERVAARITEEQRAVMEAVSSRPGWEADPRALEVFWLARFEAYFGNAEAARGLTLGLERNVYGNFPATAVAVRASLGDWDLFPELHRVTAPALIFTGDRSIFPPEAHERLREALPDGRLVVLPGVGHFPHMEAPEAFARTVSAFLDEVTGDAASSR